MEKPFGILQILKLNTSEVTCVDFNGNYLLAVGSSDRTVRVLDWKVGLGFVDVCYSPLLCHTFGVTSVRFSPMGTMLASSSLDGSTVLHCVTTGTKIFTAVQPNKISVRHCVFTSDSSKMITASDDGVFCFWDLVHRTQIRTLLHDEDFYVRGFCISPDSQYLLSADSKALLRLWFIGNIGSDQPECVSCFNKFFDDVYCCQFSPRREIDVIGTSSLKYKYFVAVCGSDNLIQILNILINRDLKCKPGPESFTCDIIAVQNLKGHVNDVLDVRFNSNGTYLASTGMDNSLKLWQMSTGNCVETLKGHTRFGTCVAFAKDSLLLATGSNDKTVIIWKLNYTKTLDDQLTPPCDITCHFVTTDIVNYFSKNQTKEKNFGKNCNNQINIFQVLNSSSTFNCVRFHGDNLLVAGGGEKTVMIWKREQGVFQSQPIENIRDCKYSINDLDVSQCGTKAIFCSIDGVVTFWNLNIGLTYEMRTPECIGGLRTCKFSPNSAYIATAGDDQLVFLWDANNLEFLRVIQDHRNAVTSLAFTPDGKFLASTCCEGDVKLYDFSTNQSFANVPNAHDLGALSCDFFSPSKYGGYEENSSLQKSSKTYTHILATCGNDSGVKMWEVSNSGLRIMCNLLGHGGAVNCVRFAPSKPITLASCGTDCTVRIWLGKTGQCLHVLNLHHSTVTTCSFSKDSSLLATGSLDKSILIWCMPEKIHLEALGEIINFSQPLQNWTSSDVANWFVDIGYPEVAEKVIKTSLNGLKIMGKDDDCILDAISLESNKKTMIKLHLQGLKKEARDSTNNILTLNIPHQFLCPISHEIMKNPVICSDGYVYDRQAINEWLLRGTLISPVTKEPLEHTRFLFHCTLSASIIKFLCAENTGD